MSSVFSRPINFPDCFHVAERMREADKKEIYATRWDENPLGVVKDCLNTSAAFGWTIGKDEPICAIGAFPSWPQVWSVWMFATDRFPEVGLFATRFVKKFMIPKIFPLAHRAQCYSASEHLEAHKWLEKLGARKEAIMEDFGKNGETFYLYRWSQYYVST